MVNSTVVKTRNIILLSFALSIVYCPVYSGIPHIVTGKIFNKDGTVPADGAITYSAYITSRPSEVQTELSVGNGYSGGYWYLGAGNFPTAWNVGDILHIVVVNTVSGIKDSLDYALTSSDPDLTPDIIFALRVKIKVFLQGPYSGGVMSVTLNTNSLIPLNSDAAYNPATYGYTVKTVGAIPNANVTDWILVELRTGTASTSKVETQVGFLLKDGSIVDVDGSSDLEFSVAPDGDYYIVIRHRNHLAIMSAAPVTLPNSSSLYDFTTGLGQAYGANAMRLLATGIYGMYAGDVNQDGLIYYIGSGNDRQVILSKIGGVGKSSSGYLATDINFDGLVYYIGSGNDRQVILTTIGSVGGSRTSNVP